MNDKKIISADIEMGALKRHDINAVSTLVKRMEAKIYRFSLSMVNDPELAEDIVQETFLAVFKGLNGFKMNSSIDTWIWSIAHKRVAKVFQHLANKEKRTIPLDQIDSDGGLKCEDTALDTLTDQHLIIQTIIKVLQNFAPEDREILILRDVMGFTNDEVAEMIGLSVTNIKSRLHRSRLLLRKKLTNKLKLSETII